MRIVAGKHKGRKIELPREADGIIRPTSEFAREAIFNILAHRKDGRGVVGKYVLDVFCGTGAFGFEALSRGAAHVTFIDQSREAIASARYNAERMHELDNCEFININVVKIGHARRKYSLVFLDPPYFEKLITPTLAVLSTGGWLAEDALVIIEHDNKEVVEIPEMFEVIDQRKYGRAVIALLTLRS